MGLGARVRRVPYLSFRLDPEDGDEGTTSGSKEVGGLTPANEPWSLESELFRPWSPSNWRTMTSSSSPGNRMATSVLATGGGGATRHRSQASNAIPKSHRCVDCCFFVVEAQKAWQTSSQEQSSGSSSCEFWEGRPESTNGPVRTQFR